MRGSLQITALWPLAAFNAIYRMPLDPSHSLPFCQIALWTLDERRIDLARTPLCIVRAIAFLSSFSEVQISEAVHTELGSIALL
jgi:hypothetical protein